MGARVGVWGTGVEGQANLRKLASIGVVPAVVVDDHPGAPVGGFDVVATGSGGARSLARCEVVVKSPGISRYRPDALAVEAAGAVLAGGLGLWLEEVDRTRVIGITGTKGKSTTAAVAGHLARNLGVDCSVGGNIGRPPWDPGAGAEPDLWVVEVSSFQATDVASSPPVVGLTSLSPDHLDWHGSVERYYADKLSLCAQPGAQLTVANGDDPLLRAHEGALGPRVEWVDGGDGRPGWVQGLGLLGRHNVRNARIAAACLCAAGVVGADDPDALAGASGGFTGLPSRLQPIGSVGGVTFVDDSLSTNVLPTIAALEVFAGRAVALLVGGHDRHIDYRPLADHLAARRPPTLVLALPESGSRVAAAIDETVPVGRLEVARLDDLASAVREGWSWARPDGVVLLSPAAASFGRYRDYAERAAAFAAAMSTCAVA